MGKLVSTTKRYYYCRLSGNIRVQKADSPKEAVLAAWGIISGQYKDVGTKSPNSLSATVKTKLQADGDWIDIVTGEVVQ